MLRTTFSRSLNPLSSLSSLSSLSRPRSFHLSPVSAFHSLVTRPISSLPLSSHNYTSRSLLFPPASFTISPRFFSAASNSSSNSGSNQNGKNGQDNATKPDKKDKEQSNAAKLEEDAKAAAAAATESADPSSLDDLSAAAAAEDERAEIDDEDDEEFMEEIDEDEEVADLSEEIDRKLEELGRIAMNGTGEFSDQSGSAGSSASGGASASSSSSGPSGGFSIGSPSTVPAIVVPFGRPVFPSAQYDIQRLPRAYLPALMKMKGPAYVGIFMMKPDQGQAQPQAQNAQNASSGSATSDSSSTSAEAGGFYPSASSNAAGSGSSTATGPAGAAPSKKFLEYIYPVGVLAQVVPGNGIVLSHRRVSITGLPNPDNAGAKASPFSHVNLAVPMQVNIRHFPDPIFKAPPPVENDHEEELTSNGHSAASGAKPANPAKPASASSSSSTSSADAQALEIRGLLDSIKAKLLAIQSKEADQFQLRYQNSPHFFNLGSDNDPGRFADFASSLTFAKPVELQRVIASVNVIERLKIVLELLEKDYETLEMQLEIQKELEEEAKRNELEKKFLHSKKRELEEKLGDGKGSKEALIDKFQRRLEGKTLTPEVQKALEEEMNKFMAVDADSSEFSLTRNYLDWLTSLPYGVYSEENHDLSKAQEILDHDHYGMEQVKERILEFIATSTLAGTMNSAKILCLSGPPGVGKTSIASSIARTLNRKFARFSVGGLDDVAEIKGHRRTYIGSLPGKLIQSLKKTGTANPVILIDEIDKLGKGWRGDPAAALLEVLDPEQNKSFVDHYLDVPIDLSRVLFVCTANDRSRIPGPLADRMEFIECAGYLESEKYHIAKRYLEVAERAKLNVTEAQVKISDEALKKLVNLYSREAGVRNLKKYIEKIYGKVAFRLAEAKEKVELELEKKNETEMTSSGPIPADPITPPAPEPIVVQPEQLVEFCGLPRFSNETLFPSTQPLPIGVAHALAWNELGGSSLFIECTVADQPQKAEPKKKSKRGKKAQATEAPADAPTVPPSTHAADADAEEIPSIGGLQVTGNIGDVMRESVTIAYTVAKRQLFLCDPHNQFFHNRRIHLHVPAGATPKDGPSAGITIVCALLSLASGHGIRVNTALVQDLKNLDVDQVSKMNLRLAMTGELSLTGRVLPIGGVKEKLLAAKRAGVTDVILPIENRKEYEELSEETRAGVRIHFMERIEQVREMAFPDLKPVLHHAHHTAQADGEADAGSSTPAKKKRTKKSDQPKPVKQSVDVNIPGVPGSGVPASVPAAASSRSCNQ